MEIHPLGLDICLAGSGGHSWDNRTRFQNVQHGTNIHLVFASFFTITLFWPENFLIFIVYETAVMLFALGGYLWIAWRGYPEGAWWMAAGIFVSILAAGVQAVKTFSFTFIWVFDQNGVYHLIQMVGVVLLVTGLRKMLLSRC